MNTFIRYYKNILVLWVAIGIGLTGFFYIYPEHVKERKYFSTDRIRSSVVKRNIYTNSKFSLLATVVGSIIIGGFGFIESNRKTKV